MQFLTSTSPEFKRFAVKHIKELALLRVPNYEMPADSFIEKAVLDILLAADEFYAKRWIAQTKYWEKTIEDNNKAVAEIQAQLEKLR